jgi:hypothetical protein
VVLLIGALLLAGGFWVGRSLAAGSAQGLSLTWWTVDGGGGQSSGGTFAVSGTAGQPDAGTLTGGDFTLTGGFWPGAALYQNFMPIVRR